MHITYIYIYHTCGHHMSTNIYHTCIYHMFIYIYMYTAIPFLMCLTAQKLNTNTGIISGSETPYKYMQHMHKTINIKSCIKKCQEHTPLGDVSSKRSGKMRITGERSRKVFSDMLELVLETLQKLESPVSFKEGRC